MRVAHQVTTIGGIHGTMVSLSQKSAAFILFVYIKACMNLNGTQRLYGLTGKNAWIINFRSSQTFNLVYTDIS